MTVIQEIKRFSQDSRSILEYSIGENNEYTIQRSDITNIYDIKKFLIKELCLIEPYKIITK